MIFAVYSTTGHQKAIGKTMQLPSADVQLLLENNGFSISFAPKSYTNAFHWQNLNQVLISQKIWLMQLPNCPVPCYVTEFKRTGVVLYISRHNIQFGSPYMYLLSSKQQESYLLADLLQLSLNLMKMRSPKFPCTRPQIFILFHFSFSPNLIFCNFQTEL